MSVSIDVMRLSDKAAIAQSSSLELMKKAGEALALCVKDACRAKNLRKAVFFNGKGNNGGDGYIAAALLRRDGFNVIVCGDTPKTDECKYYAAEYEDSPCLNPNIDKYCHIIPIKDIAANNCMLNEIVEYAVIVDCLLGTGVNGDVNGDYAKIINYLNEVTAKDRADCNKTDRKTYVVSCDMPSGLKDNGRARLAVVADTTLAIAEDKDAYYLNDGKDFAGKTRIADIGIDIIGERHLLTSDSLIDEMLRPRKKNSHKGNYGSIGIVACSENYVGAGKLSYIAALNTLGECAMRSGAGLVRLYVPHDMKPYFWTFVESCSLGDNDKLNDKPDNAIVFGMRGNDAVTADVINHTNQDGNDDVENSALVLSQDNLRAEDVYAYGMGAGRGDVKLINHIIESDSIAVIDADGLNLLSRNMELLNKKRADKIMILTPHVKEMSRLSGKSTEEILNDPINTAKEFAAKYSLIVVLKGSGSVITDGTCIYINAAGSPCLAKGGSGDVLSGIIAALAARGGDPLKAAACGAYILGKASEAAASKYGENSTLPRDIAEAIKKAIQR